MKKTIILLSAIAISCGTPKKHTPRIAIKAYHNMSGELEPKGICLYGWRKCEDCELILFEDSCSFYRMGDTLNIY